MFYLILDINHYRQLKQIKSRALGEVLKEFKTLLGSREHEVLSGSAGTLLLTFHDDAQLQLVEYAESCRQIMERYASRLFGYSIVIGYDAENTRDTCEESARAVMQYVPDSNRMWVSPAAAPSLQKFFHLQDHGPIASVISPLEEEVVFPDENWKRNQRPVYSDRLVDLVLEAAAEDTPPLVFVTGPEGVGRHETVDAALRMIMKDRPWLSFGTKREHAAAVNHFESIGGFAGNSSIPNFLNYCDRLVIDQGNWSFEQPENGVSPAEDTGFWNEMLIRLESYLRGYARFMKSNYDPPVLVFRYSERYTSEINSLLGILCKRLNESEGLLPLIIGEAPFPDDAFYEMSHRIFSLPPINEEEAAGILPEEKQVDAGELVRASFGRASVFYHLASWKRTEQAETIKNGDTSTKNFSIIEQMTLELFQALNQTEQSILYLSGISAGRVRLEIIISFLATHGMNRDSIVFLTERLQKHGLLGDSDDLLPVLPETCRFLEIILGESVQSLRRDFAEYLNHLKADGALRSADTLLPLVSASGGREASLDFIHSVLQDKLDILDAGSVEFFIDEAEEMRPEGLDEQGARDFSQIIAAAGLRVGMQRGETEDQEGYSMLFPPVLRPEEMNAYTVGYEIERARHQYQKRRVKEAMGHAKTALMFAQDHGMKEGEQRARLQLAALMLAEGKLNEAQEYYQIISGGYQNQYITEQASLGEGVVQFLWGNLSRALKKINEMYRAASAGANRRLEVLGLFLRMRIHLELGRYKQAVDEGAGAMARARVSGVEQAIPVISTWLMRAHVYAGELSDAEKALEDIEPSVERELFASELFYRRGNYRRALELLESAFSLSSIESGLPAESVRWQSGFEEVEGRLACFPKNQSILNQLIRAFWAYMEGFGTEHHNAREELERITREERIFNDDPYLHLHMYWYSSILPDGSEQESGSITVFSKALKYVQERGSRIEDDKDRNDYLYKNYWNSRLMGRAKQEKMI
ncbi:MAG: hypothetical protein K9L68_04960 [Spirochaetales bacterium]|nr:hypothetical protein [Spirochaetales bacterium]MCF7937928.1 hypothetical protein [Spirochaetales bacterium]